MIKNFFFYGCFFVLMAVSLVTCRNEYDAVMQTEKPQTYTVVHNNTTLLNKNSTLSAKLNSILQGSKNFKNSNYLDNYEIFETQVTYVKNNDKGRESYAFYIKEKNLPTDKFYLKNLVFSKLDSETIYTVQIVSYYLPEGIEKSSKNIIIENIENLDSQSGLPIKNVNGKSGSCDPSWSTIEIYHPCTSEAHHIGENSGCQLTGGDRPYSTFLLVYNGCGGFGGSSGSGDGPGNPGGPGGGTSSGGNGGHPVDTGLSLPPTCQTEDCDELIFGNEINDFLGNKLNGAQLLFLNDNDNLKVTQ